MTQRYEFSRELFAADRWSQLPDVAYSPDGARLGVTFVDLDEVAILDGRSQAELRRYSNPAARLYGPHGLVLTDRHAIVTNKLHPADRPSTITVYDLDSDSPAPVCEFTTPQGDYCEAHSIDLRGEHLVCTYAGRGTAALVTYRFDHASGRVSGPVCNVEDWFRGYGQPKGVAFNADGDRLVVTFSTAKTVGTSIPHKWRRARWMLRQKRGKRRLLTALRTRLGRLWKPPPRGGITNGIAVFPIDPDGQIAATPEQVVMSPEYCRLENVHMVNETCAIADPVNNKVMLYRFNGELNPEPLQVIDEQLTFPHDACLSPDGQTLVISNYGLKIADEVPQWHEPTDQRGDKLSVFTLGGPAA